MRRRHPDRQPADQQRLLPDGRIVAISSGEGTVDLVFQASELPPGQSVDAASVRVEVDGVEVPATAKPLGGGAKPVSRTAVLVMDVSGSMKDAGLAGAKKAAAAFLAAIPADVRVGLVTFATTARVAVAPTTDRDAVADAVDKLTADGSTELYDGTILGVTTAGTTGLRTVLLLSDGADEGSEASLTTAVATVKASKVTLDAVSFVGTDSSQARPLQLLANAGGGTRHRDRRGRRARRGVHPNRRGHLQPARGDGDPPADDHQQVGERHRDGVRGRRRAEPHRLHDARGRRAPEPLTSTSGRPRSRRARRRPG